MKTVRFFAALALCISILTAASTAYAEPKPWVWSWWPQHWENLDFEPYLENAKHPHNTQWDREGWKPEYWEQQRDSRLSVVQGFYTADVIRDQYVDDEIPVLEVGPGFYMLGGQDKRRVVEMVDYAYGVTTEEGGGMFMLRDWESGDAIGVYTRYGLQLQ